MLHTMLNYIILSISCLTKNELPLVILNFIHVKTDIQNNNALSRTNNKTKWTHHIRKQEIFPHRINHGQALPILTSCCDYTIMTFSPKEQLGPRDNCKSIVLAMWRKWLLARGGLQRLLFCYSNSPLSMRVQKNFFFAPWYCLT